MAGTPVRRTIAPLAFILALSLVTGLVWYQVLHRAPTAPKAAATTTKVTPPCPVISTHPAAWPAPKSITVSVLNATDRAGLAAAATAAMKKRGFVALKPGNASATSALTQIRYGTRYITSARLVHYYLPGSTLLATTSASPVIVVSLGTAYRTLATPAQVTLAQKAATPVRTC